MDPKLGKYFVVLPILSLLIACSQLSPLEAQNTDSKKMAQNAKTHSDHDNLANHYDNLAKEMVAKAEEKKKSLEQYEEHSNVYGRQGQDHGLHTRANIHHYEQAAEEALKQADFHRKIAAELLNRDYAESTETPRMSSKNSTKNRF
jgi:hypothetical protein